MFIYWSTCILSSILMKWACPENCIPEQRHKKPNIIIAFLSALPLILVAGLRYDVGKDYMYTYAPYFQKIAGMVSYEKLEWLYHGINVFVHRFSDDYMWVFLICAVIFICFVYLSILRDSPYPALSVFLLIGTTYYFIFLNTMRQMLGVSLCLFSLRFAHKRQLLPFLLCVFIATGFHNSCLVFALFYPIACYKFNRKWIVGITVAVVFVAEFLADKINEIVMSTAYSEYIGSRFDKGEQGFVVLAINLLLLAFIAVMKKNDKKYQMYLNLQMIATWLAILTGKVVLMNRLRWLFGLPIIISLPIAIRTIEKKEYRVLAYVCIVILYVIYTQYTIGFMNGNTVLPYQTIFMRK